MKIICDKKEPKMKLRFSGTKRSFIRIKPRFNFLKLRFVFNKIDSLFLEIQ